MSERANRLVEHIKDTYNTPGFTTRRSRMEEDYSLYRMNDFDAGEGYQSYTSNAPRILADKIVSYLSQASMSVKVHLAPSHDARESGALKEKFIIGSMNLADERMLRLGQPALREQLAFYITLRGWYAGRAVLNKRPDGTTYIDITPFDPLHIAYELDDDGIVWLAHKTRRSQQSIKATYNKDVEPATQIDDDRGIDIWDYYSREEHIIVADSREPQIVKPSLKHNIVDMDGKPCAPVFLGAVGPAPWLQDEASGDDTAKDYGESIFAQNRKLFKDFNFSMSAYKTLVQRAVRRPYKITSPDGSTTLDSAPWKDGSELPLPAGTDIQLLDEVTMPINTNEYISMVSGEIQRGGLSNVSYGELPFAISGFAAKILQEGSAHQIEPRVKAQSSCYVQIANLITMQYETGDYSTVTVRGRHNELSNFFHQEIKPADIENGGALDIKFGVRLPQDDPQLISMAQMMREGPSPLAPDEWIWENILQIEDVDQFKNAISAQSAHTTEPKAMLVTLIEGLMQTGESEKALIYIDLLRKTLKQEQQQEAAQDLQFQQLQMATQQMQQQPPAPQGAPAPEGPASLGVPGGAVSSAAQGFSPTGPPNQPPVGNPGSPGPRTDIDQRLANLGIIRNI